MSSNFFEESIPTGGMRESGIELFKGISRSHRGVVKFGCFTLESQFLFGFFGKPHTSGGLEKVKQN